MKRWPLRILICVILGAITTVAVAWGCIWLLFETPPGWVEWDRGKLREPSADDRSALELVRRVHDDQRGSATEVDLSILSGSASRLVRKYRMSTVTHGDKLEEGYSAETYYVDSGWPYKALFGAQFELRPVRKPELEWSIGVLFDPDGEAERLIPASPIWPGFVIDMLFYGAIWFGVFFGFTSAKRFLRVRRGRCPRCGYDLRGGVRVEPPATSPGCPECGWGRAGDDGVMK